MKKYYPILIITVVMLISSCKKYLAPDSMSTFTQSYVFSSVGDAKKMVLGVYALFAQDSYTSRMSSVFMQNTDIEASAPSALPDGSRRDIWALQGGLLSSFGDIYTMWQHNYLAIDRANQCIEGIQKSSLASNKDMKMMLGESYCLRAYRYFLLCNYWGDVPYFRKAAGAGMALDIPKTDKNIIYSGMIQDLVNCEPDMYFANEFPDGIERMNREFAIGMISRLALFRAGYGTTVDGSMKLADDYLPVSTNDSLAVKYTINGTAKVARTSADFYQLAEDYAQKLMSLRDRPLNPSFAAVFMNENQWIKPINDDVLYEVAFGATNGGGDVGWCIGVPVYGSSKGTTTIQFGLTPNYYYSFDANDTRRDATISKIAYNSETDQAALASTALTCNKWNRLYLPNSPGSASSKGTGINWPLMRYSDILLMIAEAENQLHGPTSLAKDMLSRVRTRAFNSADNAVKVQGYVNGLTTKDAFFTAIVNERAWEFGGECLRKFDLGRWNIYGKKIVETKTILDNMGKAAYGLDPTNPDVIKYANYADVLYYKKPNGVVTFLNTFYKPTTVPSLIVAAADLAKPGNETAYATIDWTKALYLKVTATGTGIVTYQTSNFTAYCWRGYKDATGVSAVPFLLPVPSQTVATSKYLNNNGYGLVTN
jgi:starch-binding outer membrane protein, SusD/RagB family